MSATVMEKDFNSSQLSQHFWLLGFYSYIFVILLIYIALHQS
jgi:hypothetical protein